MGDQYFKKGTVLPLGFIAPFRSGIILNSRELLVDGYADTQLSMMDKLNEGRDLGWGGANLRKRDNGMEIDTDDYSGNTVIPKFFLSRILKNQVFETERKAFNLAENLNFESPLADIQALELELRFYDYGMGCAYLKAEATLKKDITAEDYRLFVEAFGSSLSCLNDMCLKFLDDIRAHLPGRYIIKDYSAPYDGKGTSLESFYDLLPKNFGNIVWVHRCYFFPFSDQKTLDKNVKSFYSFIPLAEGVEPKNLSLRDDAKTFVGNGASMVAYSSKAEDNVTLPLTSMLEIQNVFYVAIEDMTRHLFYLNNEISRLRENRTIKELELQSRFITRYQSQISFFRAIYDDYDNTLSPQNMMVWREVEECWATANRFQDLEHKMSLAERVYDRIMLDLSNMHNKRLGIFMLVFTIFSMLSVVVDTVDFTQGGGLETPSFIRIAVLGMMFLMGSFLALLLLKPKKI